MSTTLIRGTYKETRTRILIYSTKPTGNKINTYLKRVINIKLYYNIAFIILIKVFILYTIIIGPHLEGGAIMMTAPGIL